MTAQQKKKKTIILMTSGLILIAIISAITYFSWLKKENKTETKSQTIKEKVQQLQNQLSQIKNDLDKPENQAKKTEFSAQIIEIRNELSNITSKNKQEREKTTQKLEQEIKEIKEKLENNNLDDSESPPENPDNDPPPPDNSDPSQNKAIKYVVTKINDNTFKYHFLIADESEEKLTWRSVINFLEVRYKTFFNEFQGVLKDANSKFPAYFWKCPPISKKTLDKPFEFVVIKSDALNNIQQDYSSFQEHFGKSNDNQVVSFLGFSGSMLICPVPKSVDYKNISQFTKNAPEEQQQALWKEVANKLMEELKKNADTPRWLNTEGTGVYYLHVRIDKTNKFYSNYKEYEIFGE